MTKFIQDLGAGYMNEMLGGAPFLYNGEAYLFQELLGAGKASAYKLGPDAKTCHATPAEVPSDIFDGWKAFSFPTLGYRCEENGEILVYMTRTNSTRRGLNPRDMNMVFLDVSHQCQASFGTNLPHYNTPNVRAYMAMKPSYTNFNEGLAKIMQGTIASFAISAEFAVTPSDNVPFLEILFRQRRVGTIDAKGNVTIEGVGINKAWDNVVNGEITNE